MMDGDGPVFTRMVVVKSCHLLQAPPSLDENNFPSLATSPGPSPRAAANGPASADSPAPEATAVGESDDTESPKAAEKPGLLRSCPQSGAVLRAVPIRPQALRRRAAPLVGSAKVTVCPVSRRLRRPTANYSPVQPASNPGTRVQARFLGSRQVCPASLALSLHSQLLGLTRF